MSDLSKIFKAEPKSIYDVICRDEDTGFYMPAYQRPYSWAKRNINDLIDDFENVFENLLESDQAIVFLGSILTVDDDGSSLSPKIERNHPSKINLIIDGQQRLSTLVLVIATLNDYYNSLRPHISLHINKNKNNPELLDALSELEENLGDLVKATDRFMLETSARDDLYKYQPKIIRYKIDCWGKTEETATYDSPLANYLFELKKHILTHQQTSDGKGYKLFDLKNLTREDDKIIRENLTELRKRLKEIGAGRINYEVNEEELSLEKLNSSILKNSLNFHLGDVLADYASKNDKIKEILFLSAFGLFILKRVCLTYVTVNSESYAFDMFEALNTTGEPLTAYETFVPRVIEHIQKLNDPNEKIESEKILKNISSFFEVTAKADDRNKLTKELILAFVRAFAGNAKVTHVRDQREALIRSYSQCNDDKKKKTYIEQLAFSANFLFNHWDAESFNARGLVKNSDEPVANLCLKYLKELNHKITQSLLIQFALRDQKFSDGSLFEFFEALKAVTAFSTLWRAMSGGADGIDAVYKNLHIRGPRTGNELDPPFQLSKGLSSISLNNLKRYLKAELMIKIEKKSNIHKSSLENWLHVCKDQLVLQNIRNSKLLILAACHNVTFDSGEFREQVSEKNDFLNETSWDFISKKNILTSVCDTNDLSMAGWSEELKDIEIRNKLGNVLVQPLSPVKDPEGMSWDTLASRLKSQDERARNEINDFYGPGFDTLSSVALEQLESLKFAHKFKEVYFADKWNIAAIDERTTILLNFAWANLIKWLD